MSVAPVQDLKAPFVSKSSDIKNRNEDAAAREDGQRTEAPHKTHKTAGTGGSQAHAFVRHLIHSAGARCTSRTYLFCWQRVASPRYRTVSEPQMGLRVHLVLIGRQLAFRAKLEELLKDNYQVPGGEENIKCFFREEGFQTGISNMLKVLHLNLTASCTRTWACWRHHPWTSAEAKQGTHA